MPPTTISIPIQHGKPVSDIEEEEIDIMISSLVAGEKQQPAVSSSTSSSASLTLLDTFEFDVSLPHIIDGQLPATATTTTTSATASDANNGNNAEPAIMMLGDYSEKEHFLPSSGVIRNEVLECYFVGPSVSGEGGNVDGRGGVEGGKLQQQGAAADCVAFRCIFCKHAKDRAEMATIHPKNLMSIRDSVLRFGQKHVQQCIYIPNDVRLSYLDFKAQEDNSMKYPTFSSSATSTQQHLQLVDDPFLWVSSAIRRGYRDENGSANSGIVFCPELAMDGEGHNGAASRQTTEAAEEQVVQQWTNIQQPNPTDVLLTQHDSRYNEYQGNIYWHYLLENFRTEYCNAPANSTQRKSCVGLIVALVRGQSPPGRFLVLNRESGMWSEVGDKEARNKTSYQLREAGRRSKKRQYDNADSSVGGSELEILVKEEIGEWTENEPSYVFHPAKKHKEDTESVDPSTRIENVGKERPVKLSHRNRRNGVSPAKSSIYNGVLARTNKGNRNKSFDARYSKIHLGNYVLETDAALAYDAYVRALGKEANYRKINFTTEESYLIAREEEVKARGIDHDDLEDALDITSNAKTLAAKSIKSSIYKTSIFNGVSKKKKCGKKKFEAKFSKFSLGGYLLETDAALAYDAAVKAREDEAHYFKINFATEESYLIAREKEVKARGITDDLVDTLEITSNARNLAAKKNMK